MTLEIAREQQAAALLVSLPLDGATPARLLAHVEPTADCDYALAPRGAAAPRGVATCSANVARKATGR